MEQRVWTKLKDQGVAVVGIDPGGSGGMRGAASTDDMTGLQRYVQNLQVTYPVGLEDPQTKTYLAFVKDYRGLNPFPVDVVVGKDGNIAYISREYDPDGLMKVVEAELAK